MNDLRVKALLVFALIAIVPISVMLRAWAIVSLWGWYIAPAFALPPVDYVTAFGISMLVSLLTHSPTMAKDERERFDKFCALVGHLIVTPILAVVIGWLVIKLI